MRSLPAQDLRYLSQQAWGTEEGLPQNSVHAVVQTQDGYLWVATEEGLVRFDGTAFRTYGRATEAVFESDDICCLKVVSDGSLLIGTASGWLRLKQGAFEKILTPDLEKSRHPSDVVGVTGRVQAVLIDREGLKWVGSRSGLDVIDPGTGSVQKIQALKGDSVLCLFQDSEGDLWVGTETSGLHVLRRLKFRSEPGVAGLPITSVVQAKDGAIWVGTRDDGVRRIVGSKVSEPVSVERLTSGVVLCLAAGENGGIWAGTPDGLNFISPRGEVHRFTSADGLPDDYVRALALTPEGGLWVGSGHGLALLEAGKVSKVLSSANGLKGDVISGLVMPSAKHADVPEQLWVTTSHGVSLVVDRHVVSANSGTWLKKDAVSALTLDRDGSVWVSTEKETLGRIVAGQPGGPAVVLGEAKLLGMAADELGNLWLRMSHGVRRVAVNDLERCLLKGGCGPGQISIARYGRADGLPNDEAVAGIAAGIWLMRDGELWFPTRRGVGIVDSRHLAVDQVAPPVVVQRVSVDDLTLSGDTEVRMPSGQQRLTFEYSGISFTAPTEVRYRVRLQGFDKGWVDAGSRRSATYTNLAPGSYSFRVQAVNGDGVWNLSGAEVRVQVIPPYWRRAWFLALVLLGVMALLIAIYLLRLRRLRRDFDVVLAERNRMAREIHDTLTQDFVGTSVQLDIVAQMLRRGKIEAALEQVVRTRRMVTDGLNEARRSIWELRSGGAEEGLPLRLRHLIEREEGVGSGVKLTISGALRTLAPSVEREILRVAQEALQNVRRHAQATETLIVLHYSDEAVMLSIEDNGVGFRMEDVPAGHFGLIGMEERAEMISAQLEIVSEPLKGTRLTLRVAG